MAGNSNALHKLGALGAKFGFAEVIEDDQVDFSELDEITLAEPDQTPTVETRSMESEQFDSVPVEKPQEKKVEVVIEPYEKNKVLTVEDVYRKASLNDNHRETIFMVDAFLKALPENLPVDVKRDSVLNIITASGLKVEDLLSDAYNRVDALNMVLEQTVQATEELNKTHEQTIRELELRIEELKREIQNRVRFQENQNSILEYESQRIINIIEFVKGKN